MRRCKIAACCPLAHHPCCADCKDKTCQTRCWNSPERCKCWEEWTPIRAPRKSKVDVELLLALHDQGLLQRDIADRLGCSTSTVSSVLRKQGVKRYG